MSPRPCRLLMVLPLLFALAVGYGQNTTPSVQTRQTTAAARDDAEWGMKFAREFPEIAEDNARVDRGEKAQSELWNRTSKIYRAMVDENPELAKDRETIVLAARQAKRELAAEARPRDNRPQRLGATVEIFVDDLGSDQSAAILRERVIGALVNRTTLRVLNSRDKAQTILAGAGRTVQGERFSAGGTVSSASASGGTVFLSQLGLRLLDRNGNILWAFDPSKCGNWIERWQGMIQDAAACAVLQLAKAIERDQKTSGGH
jgi:hypothetical protein